MDQTVIDRTKNEAAEFDQNFNQLFNESKANVQSEEMDDFLRETPTAEQPAAQSGQKVDQNLDENGNVIDTVVDVAGSVAKDVVLGIRQSPRRIGRGAVKGVNSMLGLIDSVTNLTPTMTMMDEEGNTSYPRFVTQGMWEKRMTKNVNRKIDAHNKEVGWNEKDKVDLNAAPALPNLAPAKDASVTGDAIEGISQFLTGLKAVDKIAKGAKLAGFTKVGDFLKGSGAASSIVRGSLADLLAFDQHEQRLSDVIQRVPALQNPVTEWLAGDDNDGVLEGKVKQAIEGAVGNTLGEALFRGIKFVKQGKDAAKQMAADGVTIDDLVAKSVDDVNGVQVNAQHFADIGDADNAELVIKKFHKEADIVKGGADQVKKVGAKLDQAATEAAGVPAEQVAGVTPSIGGSAGIKAYHGTNVDFENFDISKSKSGEAIYFSTDKSKADAFSKTRGDGNPRIVEKFIDLKNPLVLKHNEGGLEAAIKSAKAKGHDGIIKLDKNGNPLTIAAFDTSSIKDAPRQIGKPEIKINFARINGEEDIKKVMQQLANDPDLSPSVQAARRGTQTTEMTLKGAEDVDGFDELLTRRTGEAFNDQQIVAARKVYYDTTNKLLELAEKASSPTATDMDQFMFRKMMSVHHAVQKEMLGARAEAGRALRAWSIPLEGTGGQRVKDIENMLNEFGGAEATKDLAKRLTAISKTGGLTTAQINAVTNGGALARTSKALINVWQMGLLTSPRTHVVNVTSNTMTGLLLGAEKFSASLMGDTPIKAREAVEYYIGYLGSFKEALVNAGHAFKTGQTGMGLGKIDLPPINPASREILDPEGKAGMFSKALAMYGETLNRVVGGGLAAGDEFAKTTLYRGQLRALATRQGIAQGLNGDALKKFIAESVTNPDAYIKSDAMEFAAYGTYTNAIEAGGSAVQKFVAKVPAARLVVPFVRTPINIFKFTFSRTPLGLISQQMRDDLAAGGVKRSQALAKLGTGTSVMMLGTDFALNGNITGAGPTDPETRSRLRSAGWRPYSIKIGDEYYSYSRFDPFATWLGMSADMTEIMTNYEAYDVKAQEEIDQLVTAGVAAISNQVVGKTFLQGIADMTQVLSDSKRYGPQYLQQYAGSLVPAGVADIERAVSPEVEQVFNMMDAIKARIPGLSDAVPKRRNTYGEVIKNYTPGEGWDGVPERLMTMINPVLHSDPNAPDQKLDQWFLANGVDGPNMPRKTQEFEDPRSFGRVKASIDLREYPEIYDRFLELRGQVKLPQYQNMTMKKYLSGLVDKKVPGSSVFFNGFATDREKQGHIVAGIVSDYDRAIRKQLVNEFPVLQQIIIEENGKQKAMNANSGAQGLIRKKAFP